MSVELYIKKDFSGYIIDGIEATNNGDLCNMMVTRDLLSNESVNTNSKKIRVCDIGADKGTWALMALSFCPSAEILCFEPNLKTFQESSTLQTKYPNLWWYNIAISDSYGTMHLVEAGSNSNSREENCDPCSLNTVEKYSLHKFLDPTDYISLVKIDTEGHDIVILHDILPLAQENRIGSIITEFSVYWYGTNPKECLDTSKEILKKYFAVFSHIYCFSRTFPVFLLEIQEKDIDEFCIQHYYMHLQTDLCFTRKPITSVPVFPYLEHVRYGG